MREYSYGWFIVGALLLLALALSFTPIKEKLTNQKDIYNKGLAPEIENSKIYNPITEEVTVKDFRNVELARIKLLSKPNEFVLMGKDEKVAEILIDNAVNYYGALSNMELYQIKNNYSINRDVRYKYAHNFKNETTYEWVKENCTTVTHKNGTKGEVCNEGFKPIGEKELIEWIEFNGTETLPKGVLRVGIFTEVKEGDYVEWIPTFFGVRIPEWATFTQTYEIPTGVTYNTGSDTIKRGMKMFVGQNMTLVGMQTGAASTATKAYITYENCTVINSSSITSNNASFNTFLEGGKYYFIQVDKEGASYTVLYGTPPGGSYPIKPTPNYVNFTNETYGPCTLGASNGREFAAIYINISTSTGTSVDIITPQNSTYNQTSIDLKTVVSATECWYHLDGGVNSSITCGSNITMTGVTAGQHKVYFYVNDSTNSKNNANTSFVVDLVNPTVTIVHPQNKTYNTNVSLSLNYTASDNGNLGTCRYSVDGGANTTLTCGTNTTLNVSQGQHTVRFYVNDTSQRENNANVTFIADSINPLINITGPVNGSTIQSGAAVPINYTVSDVNLFACWYHVGSGANASLTCGTNFTLQLAPGNTTIYLYANDSAGNFNSSKSTFNINSSELLVVPSYPDDAANIGSISSVGCNYTTDAVASINNHTFRLYNSSTALKYNITTTLGGNIFSVNATYSVPALSDGTYTWYCEGVTNNSLLVQSSNRTFVLDSSKSRYEYKSQSYNVSNLWETENQNYSSSIWYNSSVYSSITAKFIYNTTEYSTTKIANGEYPNFTASIDIPITGVDDVNYTFYWKYTLTNATGTDVFYSTNGSQRIIWMNFSYATNPSSCPSGGWYALNMTFKNETSPQARVSASIISSWMYYIGTGTVNKTHTLSNTSENLEYDFCYRGVPGYPLKVIPSVTYDNGESNPRTYIPGIVSYGGSTTNLTLYLYPTGLSHPVTFLVVNGADQAIEGALVTVSHPTYGIISSSYTGAAGTITVYISETDSYTLNVSYGSYPTYTATSTFPLTEYTITLGSAAVATTPDYTRGITYTIGPADLTLTNGTSYTFNLSLTSTFWDLDSWGFNLFNASGSIIGSANSTSGTGGVVSTSVNTGNHTRVIMRGYYYTNSTYSNFSREWAVYEIDGTGWSLQTLVTDLRAYIDSGFFGINPFSLGLIVFVIIFVSGGILSAKFGISSPATIIGVVAALVMVFDAGLGLFPTARYLPTLIMVIVAIGFMLREGAR